MSRPIAFCPPSISVETDEAILFGICPTGLQGLRGPLGWEPAQVTAGAAAEVTVTGAASSRLPRDGADVGAAANTVAGASGGGSRIFERGVVVEVLKARGSRRRSCREM